MYIQEDVKLVKDEYAQDLVTASNEFLATKKCIEITNSVENRYQQLIKVIKQCQTLHLNASCQELPVSSTKIS